MTLVSFAGKEPVVQFLLIEILPIVDFTFPHRLEQRLKRRVFSGLRQEEQAIPFLVIQASANVIDTIGAHSPKL